MNKERNSAVSVLVLLFLHGLALCYTADDWRRHSANIVQLVDSFEVRVEVGSCLALTEGQLVFLSRDRSSLVYVDTGSHLVTSRRPVLCGWNLDVVAIAAYASEVCLLSGTTRQVFRYTPDRSLDVRDVVLDLGKTRFAGEPAFESLAYDGRYFYLIVADGLNTHIARVLPDHPETATPFAFVIGRPLSLSTTSDHIYYSCGASGDSGWPALMAFRTDPQGASPAAEELRVLLPRRSVVALCGDNSSVWCLDSMMTTVIKCRIANPAMQGRSK
jgi:hypothetical protein